MRILLIRPHWGKPHLTPPLSLGIIAALSPGHEVRIVDEDEEPIPWRERFDLVGITSPTSCARRAYEISQRFRQTGAQVVLGGIHPSLNPDEAIQHADAVVVGEAEPAWPRVLADCATGRLAGIYRNGALADLNAAPLPRYDLFAKTYHSPPPVEASRGCANQCRFCYLHEVPWGGYRTRDVEHVCENIERLDSEYVFFIDDNLFVDEDYACSLFEKMIPLKRRWHIQAPVSITKNERLMRLMADSGCFRVMLGLQSFDETTLREQDVWQNSVARYKEAVRKLHKHGIFVFGFLMFGFDRDRVSTFPATLKAVHEIELDCVVTYILTPIPGSGLYDQYEREGRILDHDLSKYDWLNCVIRPARIRPKELERGVKQFFFRANVVLLLKSFLFRRWRDWKHFIKLFLFELSVADLRRLLKLF